jgi:maltose O-acetyltransferase
MNTERGKMLAGELYNALDPELVQARDRARDLCQILNATREGDRELRRELLLKIFGKGEDTVQLHRPRCVQNYHWGI